MAGGGGEALVKHEEWALEVFPTSNVFLFEAQVECLSGLAASIFRGLRSDLEKGGGARLVEQSRTRGYDDTRTLSHKPGKRCFFADPRSFVPIKFCVCLAIFCLSSYLGETLNSSKKN